MVKNRRELIVEIAWILVGNIILSIGIGCFILPNDVLTGGLAGIAIALNPIIHVEAQTIIYVLTIIMFLLGSCVLGKRFAMKTILSTILYPTLLSITTFVTNHYLPVDLFLMDSYLATIYGGALMGIGIGCVFRTGASTGGMDIPPLILNKYTHLPLPTLVLVTDALTVMLGAAVYGLAAALTGILSVWVSSYMINKTLMIGGHETRNIMIISNKYKEIMDTIHDQLYRGTTVLHASGGFSQENKPVLMVVVARKQLHQLQQMITHIDTEAFVIVMEAKEVSGLGFTYKEEL